MPRRKSEYLSGRGFSTFIDIHDALPDIGEQIPQATVDAVKQVAKEAKDINEDKTPKKTGALRDQTSIVGYVNGNLGGTVYVRWTATNLKDGFRYAYPQEMGGVGDWRYTRWTTPGTGPGFMKATHDTILSSLSKGVAEGLQDLIKQNGV